MTKCKKKYLHLRKNLQKARYRVLEDGENWLVIVQEVEAVGKAVSESPKPVYGLEKLKEPLQCFVRENHPTASQEEDDFGNFKDLLKSNTKWKKLMWETVECAKEKELELECVKTVEQTDSKKCALDKMNGKAAIVTEGDKDLVGIITPFDLL